MSHNAGRLTKRAPLIEALQHARPPLYWIDQAFLSYGEEEDEGPRRAGRPAERREARDGEIPF